VFKTRFHYKINRKGGKFDKCKVCLVVPVDGVKKDDGENGKVYISAPPGYNEVGEYCYPLKRPLIGMPSAARAWFTTMSEFLKTEDCPRSDMRKACGK